MPPSKDSNTKQTYSRSFSNNEMSMSAKVYHQATNLITLTPPATPNGIAPNFSKSSSSSSWGRQNSQGIGKYS